MASLADMLLERLGEEAKETPALSDSQREAIIMDLRAACKRYNSPCPFKVGDLVTPMRGTNIKDAGEPHIVLEIAEQPIRNFEATGDASATASSSYGRRMDVRIANYAGRGRVLAAFWAESFFLEPYSE